MVDLYVAPSETTRGKPLPSGRAPWIALALAVSAALSIFFSMVLPYYVNDLDRFASEDLYLAGDPGQMWPYDTAYSVPFVLAWIYALARAPLRWWRRQCRSERGSGCSRPCHRQSCTGFWTERQPLLGRTPQDSPCAGR